jgi:zinc protease
MNLYNQFTKNPGYLNQDLARFAAVTPATAKKFAADYLRNDARVVAYGVPGEKKLPPSPPAPPKPDGASEAKVESGEPWRNTVPTGGQASKAALPTPKRFALPNGLQVYLVESHHLPVVAANLVLRSGSGADPKDAPGLAGFTASMLDEGTEKMDALAIANRMYALGASLSTGSSSDASNASVRALKQNAHAAMDVLGDVALAPAFPQKEVDRVRSDRLTALLQQRDQPFQTAIRVMNASLYGPTHPYGHTALGTEESLKKITRDDLVSFYKGSYGPKNAALVLVGDVTESEAKKLATDVFGHWKADGGEAPLPPEGAAAQSRVIIVDKPASPQTAVLAGQVGVARSNPDYEKLDVMNTVLGGMFSSRINLNLREDKGYSYGAFSFIGQNRGVGPVMAGAAVRSDVTGPSIDEILKEVAKMRDAGVTDAELTMAKDSMVRSLPANFETTFSTAGTLAQIYMYDLPLDYYQTLPGRVEAITRDDVGAVAKKYLTPDRMLIVAVGDKKVIEPQISKLSLGTIAYRDADGKEIAASN